MSHLSCQSLNDPLDLVMSAVDSILCAEVWFLRKKRKVMSIWDFGLIVFKFDLVSGFVDDQFLSMALDVDTNSDQIEITEFHVKYEISAFRWV